MQFRNNSCPMIIFFNFYLLNSTLWRFRSCTLSEYSFLAVIIITLKPLAGVIMFYPRFFCMTHFSMTRAISWSIHIPLDSLWFKLCLGIRFLWIKPIFFEKIAKNQYSVLGYKGIWVRPEVREYIRISLVTKRSRKYRLWKILEM